MRSRRFVISALITASFIAVAGAAHAATYDLSTRNRFFCCTNPPVFLAGAPQGMGGYHTVVATASVTGTGTPAIKIGMGHAANFYSMRTSHFPVPSVKTVKGTFSVSNGSGTLQKSGGNEATFSFCPKAKGPGPGACTDPDNATPDYFNGRIKVTPGPNRFGGTLQILAGSGGVGGTKFYLYRFLFHRALLTHGAAQIVKGALPLSPIGAMTPAKLKEGTVSSYTLHSLYSAMIATHGPLIDMVWQNGAGPFTTGMVTVQVSMNGNPPVRSVVLAGYDNRTPMGLGNIQVVSGILANRYETIPNSFVYGFQMRITTLPEPAPSLGLAAGALGLLGVGLVRARLRR